MPEDHLNHVTICPSMKPAGRNEVIQLKHTMDALLEKVGANTIEQKGPTQVGFLSYFQHFKNNNYKH